jgi:hypothetical protein
MGGKTKSTSERQTKQRSSSARAATAVESMSQEFSESGTQKHAWLMASLPVSGRGSFPSKIYSSMLVQTEEAAPKGNTGPVVAPGKFKVPAAKH